MVDEIVCDKILFDEGMNGKIVPDVSAADGMCHAGAGNQGQCKRSLQIFDSRTFGRAKSTIFTIKCCNS